MGIPFTQQHMAIRRGIVVRDVVCDFCGTAFVYALGREAVGHGTSVLLLNSNAVEKEAEEKAERLLAKQLANDIDPLPCPKCGRYQPAMIPVIRRGLYWWMYVVAGINFLAGFVSLLIIPTALANAKGGDDALRRLVPLLSGAIVGAVFGLTLLWIRKLRCEAFDPNAHHLRMRMRKQRHRTMLKADFDRDGPAQLFDPVRAQHKKGAWWDVLTTIGLAFYLAALFIGLGTFGSYMLWHQTTNGWASPNWPLVEAQIVSQSIETTTTREKHIYVNTYRPVVSYKYRLDGIDHVGTCLTFKPIQSRDYDEIRILLAPYPEGAVVEARVKPSNPAVAVLIPGIDGLRIIVLAGLIVLTLCGLALGAYTVRKYRQVRRQFGEMQGRSP